MLLWFPLFWLKVLHFVVVLQLLLQGSEVVVFMVVVLIKVFRVVMVFEVFRVIMVFKVFRVTEQFKLVLIVVEEFLFKELVFFEFILMDQEFGMVMCLW
jgi:hypothetical protein